MSATRMRGLAVLILAPLLLLGGCAMEVREVEPTFLEYAGAEVPEAQLLDIGITIFEPVELDPKELAAGEISPEIRRAESRYVPYHLKRTLQNAGYWGAVRVVPEATQVPDILITGRIRESSGGELVLQVTVVDASGEQWFQREYQAQADVVAFAQTEPGEKDLYQDLYNAIANDLLLARDQLPLEHRSKLRDLAMMKYAAELAPDAFGDYVSMPDDDRYELARLPAPDDAMLNRVLAIRQREYMLVDTLNDYYDQYYRNMWNSYENWRQARYDEAVALGEIEDEARNRFLLGAGAIIAAVAMELMGNGNSAVLRNAMILGGGYAIKTGVDKMADSKIHSQAIRELDQSFETEVQPMTVDLEGHTLKLRGSAEEQYQLWRNVLQEIYLTETGYGTGTLENSPPGGEE